LESKHWLCLSILEKMNGKFVGISGFKLNQNVAEVGFLLLPIYQGLGYATESLLAVRNYAKRIGIKELSARITKGNSASVHVIEKCGFMYKAEHERAVCINQKMYNDLEFRCALN